MGYFDGAALYPLLLPVLDVTVKIAMLIALAAVATRLLRRSAAATRHLVWLCALAASLALPMVDGLVPAKIGARYPVPSAQTVAPVEAGDIPPVSLPTTAKSENIPTAAKPTEASRESPSDVRPAGPTPVLSPFRWKMALGVFYLTGAAFVLLQIVLGVHAVRRLTRGSVPVPTDSAPHQALSAALLEIGAANGKAAPVSLRLAPDAVPMTWGWRRPTILLPIAAEDWEPERLHVVLLHELAHIVRRDWPIQMFACGVCAVYWFHPLVWWAASRLRAEGERACDDRVLLTGVASDAYAAQLLEIAQLPRTRHDGALRFAAFMARPADFKVDLYPKGE